MSLHETLKNLKFAETEVRRRSLLLEAEPTLSPADAQKLSRLRLLEELIKEQIPNENSSSPTRAPR